MILIGAPSQGISQSPHQGFGDCRQLDIDSIPGIAQLNTIMSKVSGTTVDAQPLWFARDPDTPANIGVLDSNGVFYKSTDSGANWTEISDRDGAGQGLIIKWGYAFVCETTTIDVIKMSDNSVTNNWQTIDSDALWHPMIVSSNDGKIYGGAGRYIFTIEELTTFDPANAATYTFTQQALDLPKSYRIKCLAELGNNLMIGTWQGTTVNQVRVADIFPWDRSSTSFGQPVKLDEFGVHALLNTGNSLTVLAGIEGVIYRCDGVNAFPIARLPQALTGTKYLEFFPGAIMNFKRKVFFGVSWTSSAIPGMGVYSVRDTSKGTVLNLEHLPSTGNDGTTNAMVIGCLLPVTHNTCLVGWRDSSTYGLDLSSATSYAYGTDYSGFFDSPLYEVGTDKSKWKPIAAELHLGRPLRTGEGVQLQYRTSLADSFTTIKTMAFADNGIGAIISKTFTIQIPDNVKEAEQVQFRAAFKGTSTTTPNFKFWKLT